MEKRNTMTIAELRNAFSVVEEKGFDVPFATFTWERWQEMQTQMLLGFSYFQRAVSQREPLTAALIALEIQQMATDMQKEACAWIDARTSQKIQ